MKTVHVLRRKMAPGSMDEPEPWAEWLRAGIRFGRPALAFYGGRPSFYARAQPADLPPRVLQLAGQLHIGEHQIVTSVKHDYLFSLATMHYNGGNTVRRPCFRCRCVRALRLSRARRRLHARPCGKCGYDGHEGTPPDDYGSRWGYRMLHLSGGLPRRRAPMSSALRARVPPEVRRRVAVDRRAADVSRVSMAGARAHARVIP